MDAHPEEDDQRQGDEDSGRADKGCSQGQKSRRSHREVSVARGKTTARIVPRARLVWVSHEMAGDWAVGQQHGQLPTGCNELTAQNSRDQNQGTCGSVRDAVEDGLNAEAGGMGGDGDLAVDGPGG